MNLLFKHSELIPLFGVSVEKNQETFVAFIDKPLTDREGSFQRSIPSFKSRLENSMQDLCGGPQLNGLNNHVGLPCYGLCSELNDERMKCIIQ